MRARSPSVPEGRIFSSVLTQAFTQFVKVTALIPSPLATCVIGREVSITSFTDYYQYSGQKLFIGRAKSLPFQTVLFW